MKPERFIKYIYIFALFIIGSLTLSALEVDEKLTLRLLKLSETKKTVLINRGAEDGLVVGNHAKFFDTTGVIGRGVLVKVSPSRSVWAIYRLVNPDTLRPEIVLNLKITEAIKLTNDPTKAFKNGDISAITQLPEGIPLAEGAQDIDEKDLKLKEMATKNKEKGLNPQDMNYINPDTSIIAQSTSHSTRNLEVWGIIHINALSTSGNRDKRAGETTTPAGTKGKLKTWDITLGLEKYFINKEAWYGRISLCPIFHYINQALTTTEGEQIYTRAYGFGLGLSAYPFKRPTAINSFIPHILVGGGIGAGKEKYDNVSAESLNSTNNSDSTSYSGKINFIFFGVGLKYMIRNGIGLRLSLDYYQRGEKYTVDNLQLTKKIKGPRALLGLSYRW